MPWVAQPQELGIQFGRVGQHGTTLARRDVLDRVERQDGQIGMCAGASLVPAAIVLVAGPQRVGGVLDHQRPMPPGDRLDRRQVGGLAGEIDRV